MPDQLVIYDTKMCVDATMDSQFHCHFQGQKVKNGTKMTFSFILVVESNHHWYLLHIFRHPSVSQGYEARGYPVA